MTDLIQPAPKTGLADLVAEAFAAAAVIGVGVLTLVISFVIV
jgi:hypothetical protein